MKWILLFLFAIASAAAGQTTRPVVPDLITPATMIAKCIPENLWDGDDSGATRLKIQMRQKWVEQHTAGRKFSTTMPVRNVEEMHKGKIVLHGGYFEDGPYNYKFMCLISGEFDESQAETLALVSPKEVVIIEGTIAEFDFVPQEFHQGTIAIVLTDCRLRGAKKPRK